MWWWGVCAGASCCADVLPLHETRAHVYDDLRPLMLERASSSASAASSRNTAQDKGDSETPPPGMYTARHRGTHDLVALKVFRKKMLSRQETRRRLRREVQILSMCKEHPNLLTLYGVYSTSTTFEIAFELARGGEVMNRIHSPSVVDKETMAVTPRERAVSLYNFCESEVSRVLASVVDGLSFLHAREVVHGEVRPEHILYSDTEPDARVLLVDFGRAATWNTGGFTLMSRNGSCTTSSRRRRRDRKSKVQQQFLWDDAHSTKFLPPFALHRQDDTLRSWQEARQIDTWALGVTMYVLLFARFPFDGDDSAERTVQSVLNDKLSFPDDGARISRAAKDLLQRLLVKDPDEALTIDQIRAHPWIQERVASDICWGAERIDEHRAFAMAYNHEVAVVSRRRRVSDGAYSYSLRDRALPALNQHSHGSSSRSSKGEDRDRFPPEDAYGNDDDDSDMNERPSFVSTTGVQAALDAAADELPSADGYMRMASEEIDVYTRGTNTRASSDSSSSPLVGKNRTLKKHPSVDSKLWHVLTKQRRFFSFRSSSSSGSFTKSDPESQA
ncbi:hypothetical protein Gpo141_00009359 [Globisporangium polare]